MRKPSFQRRSTARVAKRSLVTGTALTLPLLLTVFALVLVWNFLTGLLSPFEEIVAVAVGGTISSGFALEVATGVVLVVVIFLVGIVAETRSSEGQLAETFDQFMGSVPGIGTVYTTANQLSEVLFESDTQSFQEVKLVEFPTHDVYMIAFRTAKPHAAIREATGADTTLFLPMAPNPFMNGFLINVPEERVIDTDLTVEEGVQSVVTSGVATASYDEAAAVEDAPEGTVPDAIYRDLLDTHSTTDEEGTDSDDTERSN